MSRIMLYVIIIIAAIILAEVIVYRAVRRVRSRKMARIYVEVAKHGYRKYGVMGVLEAAAGQLPPRSIEGSRVRAACGYLTTSILKDYKTAFDIVEQGFFDGKVHAVNQKMLEAEQEKIKTPMLLPGSSSARGEGSGEKNNEQSA